MDRTVTFHFYNPASDTYFEVTVPAEKTVDDVADSLLALMKECVVQNVTRP